jgi:hypothetical protein
MEASRRPRHTIPPWEDPEVRRHQAEALGESIRRIESELTPEELKRSDLFYDELLARAETWPQ